ncbi:MAG: hypothetical protein KDA85_05920 [Planctomycetaceae bacterium]|nr:hypothetical protein [Planctomycetaceae bacterium]
MPSRRAFLATSAAALTALPGSFLTAAGASSQQSTNRPRIAFIGTWVRRHSHAQHFLDRLTLGYSWQGQWQYPRVDVASVYIDQFPAEDLAHERIARHQLAQFDSVRGALTLGGDSLAVDGIVIIGEHGDYPTNEKGQTLYPRYKWFQECVQVFEQSGRSCPIFNDKHLSTDWAECQQMVDDSRRLKFPFLAGSSLPVTKRFPSIDMPWGADLKESVCIAYGGIDSYDIHALETAQCMSERRRGGETGVQSVLALRDEAAWTFLAQADREVTRRLIEAAFNRSHNLPVEGGYPTDPVTFEWARKALPSAVVYHVIHRDGFRTTMMLTGIRDFNYAGYIADQDQIVSCQMYLPMPNHGSTTADFFNPLTRHIEDMILSGKAPYPIERTLLTSGMVIAGVNSLHDGQKRVPTPHLSIEYSAPRESTFWRE